MTLTLIILIYILMAALTAYLLGRVGHPELGGIGAALWPVALWLLLFDRAATLGAKHRRGE